ncbi:MAG: ABC transporter permease [Lachnospiraceae bacterium]|nr:ABC transporter permease [Lachnospiraceae bacterium]
MTPRAYFLIQLKRLRKLLKIMVPILAVITLLVAVGGFVSINNTIENNRMKVKVGLCGDTSTPVLKLGINFLTAFDDSQYLIEILPLEEEEAKDMLRHEEISAYVVVPEGFEDAVNNNQDTVPLRYYASRGQKNISSHLMDHIAESISDMIVRSNAGVLAYGNILQQDGAYDGVMVESLFLKDMELLLRRNVLLTYEEVGIRSGATTTVYFLFCIDLFLLLLFSFAAAPYFYRRDLAFQRLVFARGLSPDMQIMLEFCAYLVTGTIWWACICVGSGFILLPMMRTGSFIHVAVMLYLSMVMFSCLHLFMYEHLNGIISQIALQFFVYLFMAYCSGYFYPRSLLPSYVQTISKVFPTGFCLDGVLLAYEGTFPIGEFFAIFMVGAFCVILSILRRSERVQRRNMD